MQRGEGCVQRRDSGVAASWGLCVRRRGGEGGGGTVSSGVQRRNGGVRAACSGVKATCSGVRAALRLLCGGVGALCTAKKGGGDSEKRRAAV